MNSIVIWIAQSTPDDCHWEAQNCLALNWVVLVMMNVQQRISLDLIHHQCLYRNAEEIYKPSVETNTYLIGTFNQTCVCSQFCFEFFDWSGVFWMLNLMNSFPPFCCYSETQLDIHIPHNTAVGGQSASCLSKGKRRGRNTQWFYLPTRCTGHGAYQYKQ